MRFWTEISDRLAGLTGVASPEETRAALNEFDVRDIQAVRVSENSGGGGGGGNVPFVGVDPPADPTDGMLWWDPDDDTPVNGSSPAQWFGPCKIGAFDGQRFFESTAGSANGGDFTLSLDGDTTPALAFDASAAAIAAAILSAFGLVATVVKAGADITSDTYVTFRDAEPPEMMTADGAGLTGPDAPYTVDVSGAGSWAVEMFTPAVGDIVEDFLHVVITAFDTGAVLNYTDNTDDPVGNAPVWSNPGNWSGVTDDGLDLTTVSEFTNFTGNGTSGDKNKPSALQAMQAAPVTNGVTDSYSNLPTVALNAVPVYSYVSNVDVAPTQGEVWIWVKKSTPGALE